MFDSTTPYVKSLGNGLTLKSVGSREDVERLSLFNDSIHGGHGEGMIRMTRHLILYHPRTRPEHWIYVEDDATGQIVSSLCLIPWVWRFDGVELNCGEMGIVGTNEAYRGKGLIRALDAHFKELLRAGEFDLSHIQGIPYFYRQFGYEYAMPLEGGWAVGLPMIPDTLPKQSAVYHFREATVEDLPVLMRMYEEAACDLDISAQRTEADWRYLFDYANDTEMACETWLVLDSENRPVGYWRIALYGFGEELNIHEVSRLSQPAAIAILGWLKKLTIERNKPFIRLNIPANTSLVQAARAWGAQDLGTYSWQIHLPDVARLLRKLIPVFERRIAASSFAGLTETVRLNLYREAYDLRFESGRLTAVEPVHLKDASGALNIPPLLFAPLVLGWRTVSDLRAAYPDVSSWGQSRYLIDTLFPRMTSFIYTIY